MYMWHQHHSHLHVCWFAGLNDVCPYACATVHPSVSCWNCSTDLIRKAYFPTLIWSVYYVTTYIAPPFSLCLFASLLLFLSTFWTDMCVYFMRILWKLLISHTIWLRCQSMCGSLLLCSMNEWIIFRSLRLQNNRSLETRYTKLFTAAISIHRFRLIAFLHSHIDIYSIFIYFNCHCKNYRIHVCRLPLRGGLR